MVVQYLVLGVFIYGETFYDVAIVVSGHISMKLKMAVKSTVMSNSEHLHSIGDMSLT